MPDPNVAALLAYLRQNSGRFSLEALELQMHAAGHTPATVREALARFLAASPAGLALGGERPAGMPAANPPAALPPPSLAPTFPAGSPGPAAGGSLDPGLAPPSPGLGVPSTQGVAVSPASASATGLPAAVAPRPPAWVAAGGVAAFNLLLAGAGFGLVKSGEGKAAWLGGCVLILVPLALLLELLVGLVLTASDSASRAGRALLYGSLLLLGLAALALAGAGVYLAARTKAQ